jgi:hypothetical protein
VFVALTAATANDAGNAGNGMNAELGITWEEINIRATNTRTRNECQYRLHVLQFSGSFGEMVGEGINVTG